MSRKMKKDRQSLRHIFSNTVFMLRYAFRYLPVYSTWLIIIQVLFGLNDVLWGVLLMKIAVDAVTVTQSFCRPIVDRVRLYRLLRDLAGRSRLLF